MEVYWRWTSEIMISLGTVSHAELYQYVFHVCVKIWLFFTSHSLFASALTLWCPTGEPFELLMFLIWDIITQFLWVHFICPPIRTNKKCILPKNKPVLICWGGNLTCKTLAVSLWVYSRMLYISTGSWRGTNKPQRWSGQLNRLYISMSAWMSRHQIINDLLPRNIRSVWCSKSVYWR